MTAPSTPGSRAARMTATRRVMPSRPQETSAGDDGTRASSHHDAPLEVDGRPTFALQGATG